MLKPEILRKIEDHMANSQPEKEIWEMSFDEVTAFNIACERKMTCHEEGDKCTFASVSLVVSSKLS